MVKLLATASEVPRAHTSSIRRSEPVRPARDRSWHLAALFSASLLLTACAHTPPPVQIHLPDSLRAKCEHPTPEGVQTVGQLAGYSIKQDAAIDVCDARRAAVVAIVDGANAVASPPKRKRFLLF